MKKKQWILILIFAVFYCAAIWKQTPSVLNAAWNSSSVKTDEEETEYEEQTIYAGNEIRIPMLDGDYGWNIENSSSCSITEDKEAKEYILSAKYPGDSTVRIWNIEGKKKRVYLFHVEEGPYQWGKVELETLQKKSCVNTISGLKPEELASVSQGKQVQSTQTGELLSNLEFWLEDDWGIRLPNKEYLKSYIKNGKIYFKFLKSGTFTLNFCLTVLKDGKENYYKDSCYVIVEAVGFPEQPFAVAKGGSRKVPLMNYETIEGYSSSNEAVAIVEADGTIRGIAEGQAVITASGTTVNKTKETTECTVTVTNPRLKEKPVSLIPSYGYQKIEFEGVETFSNIELTSSNENILWTGNWSSYYGGSYGGSNGGTAKLTITVDGKKLYSKKITVYAPELPEVIFLAVGEKNTALTQIKLPSSDSTVSYSSSDWAIVNINKSSGRIKGASEGSAEITVKIDEFTFSVPVYVITDKTVAKAINYAVGAIGSTYDQSKRMQEGYYDCSSLVWRAYHAAGKSIGGSSTYAPTAANIAKHMVENGKEITDLKEVKAGDLLFYGGSGDRYRGIWHVSLILNAIWEPNFWTDGEALTVFVVEAGSGGVKLSYGYLSDEEQEEYTITRPLS